jgi:hypothetical protein
MVLKLGHFGKYIKIPGMFLKVMVEKDGEAQFHRSCEKRRITQSQGEQKYATYGHKKKRKKG